MPKRKQRMVVHDQRHITLLGPSDASSARIRFVERVLTSALKDLCTAFNHDRFPQMRGFTITTRSPRLLEGHSHSRGAK
jgi:hypothetical protein